MVLLNREIRLFCFPFVLFCLPFVFPVFCLPAFRYSHVSVRNVGFAGVCEPEEPSRWFSGPEGPTRWFREDHPGWFIVD